MNRFTTYRGVLTLATEEKYSGRGGQAPWNPTKIITSLRNLARWQSVRALLNRRTKLLCEVCHAVQPVIDYKPLASLAVLKCGHTRSVSTMTAEEYADLVRRASGLKIRVVRNPTLGGFEVIQEETQ